MFEPAELSEIKRYDGFDQFCRDRSHFTERTVRYFALSRYYDVELGSDSAAAAAGKNSQALANALTAAYTARRTVQSTGTSASTPDTITKAVDTATRLAAAAAPNIMLEVACGGFLTKDGSYPSGFFWSDAKHDETAVDMAKAETGLPDPAQAGGVMSAVMGHAATEEEQILALYQTHPEEAIRRFGPLQAHLKAKAAHKALLEQLHSLQDDTPADQLAVAGVPSTSSRNPRADGGPFLDRAHAGMTVDQWEEAMAKPDGAKILRQLARKTLTSFMTDHRLLGLNRPIQIDNGPCKDVVAGLDDEMQTPATAYDNNQAELSPRGIADPVPWPSTGYIVTYMQDRYRMAISVTGVITTDQRRGIIVQALFPGRNQPITMTPMESQSDPLVTCTQWTADKIPIRMRIQHSDDADWRSRCFSQAASGEAGAAVAVPSKNAFQAFWALFKHIGDMGLVLESVAFALQGVKIWTYTHDKWLMYFLTHAYVPLAANYRQQPPRNGFLPLSAIYMLCPNERDRYRANAAIQYEKRGAGAVKEAQARALDAQEQEIGRLINGIRLIEGKASSLRTILKRNREHSNSTTTGLRRSTRGADALVRTAALDEKVAIANKIITSLAANESMSNKILKSLGSDQAGRIAFNRLKSMVEEDPTRFRETDKKAYVEKVDESVAKIIDGLEKERVRLHVTSVFLSDEASESSDPSMVHTSESPAEAAQAPAAQAYGLCVDTRALYKEFEEKISERDNLSSVLDAQLSTMNIPAQPQDNVRGAAYARARARAYWLMHTLQADSPPMIFASPSPVVPGDSPCKYRYAARLNQSIAVGFALKKLEELEELARRQRGGRRRRKRSRTKKRLGKRRKSRPLISSATSRRKKRSDRRRTRRCRR